jgi:exonuclease SbcC
LIDVPLRSIFISDFRRLEGHRTLPLDAPIVLLHGPNGTGKTSVLSALELALTGEVRGMRRQDPRYTAHLPFHGQQFATVRVAVSDRFAATAEPTTMTVGGSRVEGSPAFTADAAQFYAERCYLDQVSLGQLLELYQYREGKEESALTRFVNELLGLDQLDALRSGLSDATDFRRLKKLSEPLDEAEADAQRANTDLTNATRDLETVRGELNQAQEGLVAALRTLGLVEHDTSELDAAVAAELLRAIRPAEDREAAVELSQSVAALGGRIEGLLSRPSASRLGEARSFVASVSARLEAWRLDYEPAIAEWRRDAAALELPTADDGLRALDAALREVDEGVARHGQRLTESAQTEQQLIEGRGALSGVEADLQATQELAGSLAEGLALIREHSVTNTCPVCDRDFGQVSSVHLVSHIDQKIAEITSQGDRLRQLRTRRDAVESDVRRLERLLAQVRSGLLTEPELEALDGRRVALMGLRARALELQPVIRQGIELQAELQRSKNELAELEAVAQEVSIVRSELERLAQTVEAHAPDPGESMTATLRRISALAADRVTRAELLHQAHVDASDFLRQKLRSSDRVRSLKEAVTEAAERKRTWESRVSEARRRQGVARAVHDASSKARAAIVQRVFTESLNDAWRSVFTRLAPREPFVPSFGIPTTSKTALELTLETVHISGEPGGPPRMMLSAGNLNTAALSLFIALHFAVQPLVPCLVFDDPVQSMDEVHVAQFAGLVRVLSKHHGRQIVIAVHERELFEYLALELSPAFEGDELITVELGVRSEDGDHGVTRRTWSPDPAIAV